MSVAVNTASSSSHRAAQSLLLRLPRDLMEQLSRFAPPRGKNQFVIGALEREIARQAQQRQSEREAQLKTAALRLNTLEAEQPTLAEEGTQWVSASLTEADAEVFEAAAFEGEFAQAQAALPEHERPS